MRKLFEVIVDHPRSTFAGAVIFALISGLPIAWIQFDNRPDAFIPFGHPALIAKQRVESEFGLRDPMMLALITGNPDGIFRPQPMALLKEITEEILKGLRDM